MPVQRERDMVQTGGTSCGVCMWNYGGVYRHIQGMTEWLLSKQCSGMDSMERWFRYKVRGIWCKQEARVVACVCGIMEGYIGTYKE